MAKKKRGARRRKKRTHAPPTAEELAIPKSFVVRRGTVGTTVRQLESDLRAVMQPHTATNLKERKQNSLKDFVNVAGPLGVKNILVLSSTEHGAYLRVIRTPQGPTLTFRIAAYSLMGDIARAQKRPHSPLNEFKTPPLVVMNNFGSENRFKLTSTIFKGLFPSLNVHTSKLSDCRRVLLLDYDEERDIIEFRHYKIVVRPVGINRAVKKIVLSKRVPQLSKLQDVSDLVLGGAGALSDSEGDEMTDTHVALGDKYVGPGNRRATNETHRSAVRMREIGPRMSLQLLKIQEGAGVATGAVLYHALKELTPEERAELKRRRQEKVALKAARRAQQEANIKRKRGANNDNDDNDALLEDGEDDDEEFAHAFGGGEISDDSVSGQDPDSDLAWYRQQVGEEPDDDFRATAQRDTVDKDDDNDGESKKSKMPWFKARREEQKKVKQQQQQQKENNKKGGKNDKKRFANASNNKSSKKARKR